MLDMNDAQTGGSPDFDSHDDANTTVNDFLKRAQTAADSDVPIYAVYMFLAAYELAELNGIDSDEAIDGLKEAWAIAYSCRERSLAEYLLEVMDPYLDDDEFEMCTKGLQDMALDRLEEFGLSRDDLTELAGALRDMDPDFDDAVFEGLPIELNFDTPSARRSKNVDPADNDCDVSGLFAGDDSADTCPRPDGEGMGLDKDSASEIVAKMLADVKAFSAREEEPASEDAKSEQLEPVGQKGSVVKRATMAASNNDSASTGSRGAKAIAIAAGAPPRMGSKMAEAAKSGELQKSSTTKSNTADFLAHILPELNFGPDKELLTYSNLAGYDSAVASMRKFGFGMFGDEDFRRLVEHLNACHGLSGMPPVDTIMLSCQFREDANRFALATLGELNLPTVYMRLEENYHDMPILCVSAHAPANKKVYSMYQVLENGGVLVLEDLDLWTAPVIAPDEGQSFFASQVNRGAQEVVNLIDYAVSRSDVYVVATATSIDDVDPFFLDLLEPISVVDIDLPTPEDRVQIWLDIARIHPSIAAINKADLVRVSANMPRFDIYTAVKEAVEEAYRQGLTNRAYRPVTRQNLYAKLASFQSVDSAEYAELVDAVVQDFQKDIKDIDALLGSEE
jgi:hypothetical protein